MNVDLDKMVQEIKGIDMYEELRLKNKTLRKLELQISKKDKLIHTLQKENDELLQRVINTESKMLPLKRSVDLLTAEKSNWLKKLKRESSKQN
jgi:hypothetical protein